MLEEVYILSKADKRMSEISENLATDTVNKLHELIGEKQQQQNIQYQDPV